jgi:hypothetical protein
MKREFPRTGKDLQALTFATRSKNPRETFPPRTTFHCHDLSPAPLPRPRSHRTPPRPTDDNGRSLPKLGALAGTRGQRDLHHRDAADDVQRHREREVEGRNPGSRLGLAGDLGRPRLRHLGRAGGRGRGPTQFPPTASGSTPTSAHVDFSATTSRASSSGARRISLP